MNKADSYKAVLDRLFECSRMLDDIYCSAGDSGLLHEELIEHNFTMADSELCGLIQEVIDVCKKYEGESND